MKSSLCLLTACDSVQQPLADLTIPRMQAFADAHGYRRRHIHRDDWQRPRGWLKIEAIRAALDDGFDFVLWMDIDTVVLRNDVDIRTEAVDGASLQMVWHGPDTSEIMATDFIPHFNSGIMLIRADDWSRAFFKRVWEVGQLPHHWFDQATILHLLGYDGCLGLGPDRPDEPNRSRLACLDAGWNSIPGLAMASDPIVHHYAGIGTASTRRKIVEADALTAAWRERLGPDSRRAFARQFSLWRDDAFMRDWVTAERDAALAKLQAAAQERDHAFAERDAAFAARDATLAELDIVKPERDSALAELEAVAAQRLGFLAERDTARAQLAAVRRSTSWLLTAPLRWTRELFSRR